ERLLGGRFTANVLPVLRVQPLLGRNFTPEEEQIGHETSVLLSYGLWQRHFGGDKSIVSKQIMLNGVPHTVVGVMGRDFQYPTREFALWVPLSVNPDDY